MKKGKIQFVIFLIFFSFFAGHYYNLYCFNVRTTYDILDEKGNLIGIKVLLVDHYYDNFSYKGKNINFKHTYIYILPNGNFLQIIHAPDKEYGNLQFKKNRKKKMEKVKDVGLETDNELLVKINGKEKSFILYGDTTYVYLKDEEGKILRDENAFEYLISKVPEMRDFIEILACDDKRFIFNFHYVFEKIKEKLNLDRKKYHLKEKFHKCGDIEKSLIYDCSIYTYWVPDDEDRPRYII